MQKTAQFRFYEELNDFLPSTRRKKQFSYEFQGSPSVKDAIESIGVPHTEIDLILVNSISVKFTHHLADGDKVSIYPVFESLDISNVTHLREKPLRDTRFILDVHLGKLARRLRLLGFDSHYNNNYTDPEIINIAKADKRIILTRDVNLLKTKTVTHGYWIRSHQPLEQLNEIIHRFDLSSLSKPFSRCMECNGLIEKASKESVLDILPQKTRQYYDEYYRCTSCKKVYWKGSHYDNMKKLIHTAINQ